MTAVDELDEDNIIDGREGQSNAMEPMGGVSTWMETAPTTKAVMVVMICLILRLQSLDLCMPVMILMRNVPDIRIHYIDDESCNILPWSVGDGGDCGW